MKFYFSHFRDFCFCLLENFMCIFFEFDIFTFFDLLIFSRCP